MTGCCDNYNTSKQNKGSCDELAGKCFSFHTSINFWFNSNILSLILNLLIPHRDATSFYLLKRFILWLRVNCVVCERPNGALTFNKYFTRTLSHATGKRSLLKGSHAIQFPKDRHLRQTEFNFLSFHNFMHGCINLPWPDSEIIQHSTTKSIAFL